MIQNKEELEKIVRKSVETIWYERRSVNPVDDQTKLLTDILWNEFTRKNVPITDELIEKIKNYECNLFKFTDNCINMVKYMQDYLSNNVNGDYVEAYVKLLNIVFDDSKINS